MKLGNDKEEDCFVPRNDPSSIRLRRNYGAGIFKGEIAMRKNGRNGNGKPEIGMPVVISIGFFAAVALVLMFGASSQEVFEAREVAKMIVDSTWVLVDKQLSEDCKGVLLTFAAVSDTSRRWSRIVDRLHEGFSDFGSVKVGEIVRFEFSVRALYGNPHDFVSYLRPKTFRSG